MPLFDRSEGAATITAFTHTHTHTHRYLHPKVARQKFAAPDRSSREASFLHHIEKVEARLQFLAVVLVAVTTAIRTKTLV